MPQEGASEGPDETIEKVLGQMALEKGREAHRLIGEARNKISPEALESLENGLALKIGRALLDYTRDQN